MYTKCSSCSAMVPQGHKFCGQCGSSIEESTFTQRDTKLYGSLMKPGRARLVLISGTGTALPGLAFMLNAKKHDVGRVEGVIIFEEDTQVSPQHGSFYYEDGKLFVHDDQSLNGTFVRVKKPAMLEHGDVIRIGAQILRFEALDSSNPIGPDGTMVYGSPDHGGQFRLVHVFEGGIAGQVWSTGRREMVVGREGCDIDFYDDEHLSRRHARIVQSEEGCALEDLDSSNGTYLRIRKPEALNHGDYVFLGQQLLRVEIVEK